MTSSDALIDEFVRQSSVRNGQAVEEQAPWHRVATADAIRHFAFGISDDNPLWLDADYAAGSPYAMRVAPPSFLLSVHYPALHGAPMQVPLTTLVAELEYCWHEPIREGDAFTATAQQTDVVDSRDRRGRREQVHVWRAFLDRPYIGIPAPDTFLDQDERRRAARFRFAADRRRYEAAHFVLREVLARYLRLPPGRIERYRGTPEGNRIWSGNRALATYASVCHTRETLH